MRVQFFSKCQGVLEKLLPAGTRRRYYYELGLMGIRVILNEGWRSFFRKLSIWFRLRRVAVTRHLPADKAIGVLPNLKETSKRRWRVCKPDAGLTWGREISGDNFILKVLSYDAFSPEKSILEIGPGYGRLLKACLERNVPFKSYCGIDISPENVRWLRKNFSLRNVYFIQGDVESASFKKTFDVVLSSLTFKHLFPSFEEALSNVVNFVNRGGMFFFDLIEGEAKYFEGDGVTYIRHYTRSEILQILRNVRLELVAFDEVWHDPDHFRLLVVAKKPE